MSNSSEQPTALVVRAGDGELISAAGVQHLFKLTGQHTGGRFGIERFEVPPATLGARPHIHRAHDEYFYVLSGRLTVATGDGEVVLEPGDLAAAVRGSVHGFRNAADRTPAVALCMYTPPGYEQYFRDVHAAVEAGAELTVDLLRDLRAQHSTESR
ncbi:MAG: cupin domain-containing protein [Jatrophihabitantaceae bacterium]